MYLNIRMSLFCLLIRLVMSIIKEIRKADAITYMRISAMEYFAKEKTSDRVCITDTDHFVYIPSVKSGNFFITVISITVISRKHKAAISILRAFCKSVFLILLFFFLLFIAALSAIGAC